VRRTLGVLALAAALLAVAAEPAAALRLVRVAGSFSSPVHLAAPRSDREGTLYVVEQPGRIIRLAGGRRTVFLDIRDIVLSGGERGLLSVAFHPNYRNNGFFYVNFTNRSGDTRVVRFRANATRTRGLRSTARIFLRLDQPFSNHNGGQLAFGPDGLLYDGQGDGGSGCDPGDRAQDLGSNHGKLLRRNVDNPSAGWQIVGYGLRNPWRFSFDRMTGRLYIGDVGQGEWEEIDTLARSGLGGAVENYGWRVFEGRESGGCGDVTLGGPSGHKPPLAVYSHSLGCSVTGGHVYRGTQLSSLLRGWYFFADYCSGRVWRLRVENGRLVTGRRLALDTNLNISSFGEGVAGELYVLHHGGTVYKLARG
jgi:glucose/arabinose dehydrogenase